MRKFDRCIQVDGDPTIFKVKGTKRVGYETWEQYVADGQQEVQRVTAEERDALTLVTSFPAEFEHVGGFQPAKRLITNRKIEHFERKSALFAMAVSMARGDLHLEFGALTGATLNVLAELIAPRCAYGFDSFEGLPEDWGPGFKKGHFKTAKRPQLLDNAELVTGWFKDTLVPFLAEHVGVVAFAHVDSDVYSSAYYVLTTMAEQGRIQHGTVIQFDEYFANKDGKWFRGEYDAFMLFVREHKVRYRYIGEADEAAAVYVEGIG